MRFCSRRRNDPGQAATTNNQAGQGLVRNEPTGLLPQQDWRNGD